MRRAFWGKVAVVLAAGLAIMTLPACDDGYRISIERAVLFPFPTNRSTPEAIPLEVGYNEFEVPAGFPGILRVEFDSGTRYASCTLNFDGSRELEVRQKGNGGYYVEKALPGLVQGRHASGSLTCLKPTDLSRAFTDTFTIVVRGSDNRIAARPLEVYYGDTRVGATDMGQMIMLTNLGVSAVSVNFRITGTGSAAFRIVTSNCRGAPLRPGRQCAVVVGFAPIALEAVEAALEIVSSPSRPTDSVRLIGRGVPTPVPIISISTDREFLGSQYVGQSASATIGVKNDGSAPLVLGSMALEGDPISWFSLSADNCSGRSLGPGESCAATVTMTPRAVGTQRAELRFTSNAAGSPHAVVITGSGIATPAPTPTPTPSPACDPYHYPYC